MKTRIAQLVTRVAGIAGVGISSGMANEIAAVIIGVVTLAVDLWLHRKQAGAK